MTRQWRKEFQEGRILVKAWGKMWSEIGLEGWEKKR